MTDKERIEELEQEVLALTKKLNNVTKVLSDTLKTLIEQIEFQAEFIRDRWMK